jgi:hypothetical protein
MEISPQGRGQLVGNPEKSGDVDWFASLAQASPDVPGDVDPNQEIDKPQLRLRRVGDNFVLTRTKSRAAKPLLIDSRRK